ncbi:MAG: glycine--tRNA ligase subunit beta [Elusimicrobia bacterium]|nr:glycine--tRNA ligase subunit beta [Elusimicrobiota bacterium]
MTARKAALLEIGTESLPARFVPPALAQMERLAAELLRSNRLAFAEARAYGTPMRLAILIRGLAEKSAPETREVLGPPARLLKDDKGAFTPQALGFARAQGVDPEALLVQQSPKGEVLLARRALPEEPASKVLERVFTEMIARIEFPKGLEWEESRFRFGRPIRSLVALYGKRVVPFKLAGVRSGAKSRGLAALGQKPVAIADPEDYLKILRGRCVLADPDERRGVLLKGLEDAAKRSSGRLDADEDLIREVLFLCEHPVPVLGRFEKAHLELPQSLLTTVLKRQLKFFPLLGKDGRLAAEFIGVRDGLSENQKEVQEGYERVIEARLSDARFFYERDRETSLAQKRPKLALLGFQKGLGSMLDKSERTLWIVRWLCERLRQDVHFDESAAQAIAELCHADLVADVVKEFPELQGAIGGVYARLDGLGERVALGLEEFYFPAQAKAPLPSHLEGCLASLAGKLDSIAALFAIGCKPSGSEDPFALRRLGNGAVRILLEKQIRLPASELIDAAVRALSQLKLDPEKVRTDVEEFLWQRAESLFLDQGFKIDEVRSVREGGLDDLPRTYKRLAAVHALRSEAEFTALAQAFKRAANILKQSKDGGAGEVDRSLLSDEAEKALFEALARIDGEVRSKASVEDYEAALRALVRIKPELDAFFDKVMVMAEDRNLRRNRLSLLARLVGLFKSVADVSQIQN